MIKNFTSMFLAIIMLVIASSAFGAEGDKATAKKHFKSGLTLIKAEDFDAAAIELSKSIEIYPTKSAYFNLANCYRALHQYGSALEIFKKLLNDYGAELHREMKKDITKQIEEIKNVVAIFSATTNVPGASITVDGKKVGVTPLPKLIYLAPGKHTVEVSLTGYDTIVHPLRVTSGTQTTESFELKVSQSELSIVASEDGSNVYIDGEMVGTTPLKPIPLAEGSHQVKISKQGFVDVEETVELAQGDKRSVTFQLNPEPSKEVTPAVTDKKKSKRSPIFWAGLASTVALGGVSGAMWGMTISKQSDYNGKVNEYNKGEPDSALRESVQNELNDMDGTVKAFNGAAIGTAVATGAAAAMMVVGLVIGRTSHEKNDSQVAVYPTPNGVIIHF